MTPPTDSGSKFSFSIKTIHRNFKALERLCGNEKDVFMLCDDA